MQHGILLRLLLCFVLSSDHFEAHNCFGLQNDKVIFFQQGCLPRLSKQQAVGQHLIVDVFLHRGYLEAHKYFASQHDQIIFFQQGLLPCLVLTFLATAVLVTEYLNAYVLQGPLCSTQLLWPEAGSSDILPARISAMPDSRREGHHGVIKHGEPACFTQLKAWKQQQQQQAEPVHPAACNRPREYY